MKMAAPSNPGKDDVGDVVRLTCHWPMFWTDAPFPPTATGEAPVPDWPGDDLTPAGGAAPAPGPSMCSVGLPPTDCPKIVDGPQLSVSLVCDRSLALDVVFFGDRHIAMASSTATTKTSSKRNGIATNGTVKDAPTDERDAIEANDRDFFWTYTEEPHRTRRLAIIKAHPEVHSSSVHSGEPSANNAVRSRSSAVPSP